MSSVHNYYDILECSPSATYEELKTSYQKLVKLHHPDKLGAQPISSSLNEKFLLLDEAWKVLRDGKQRKIYDSLSLQSKVQENSVVYAEITTNSLIFHDSLAHFVCRCGASVGISEEDFKNSEKGEEILYECSECSNNILVTVS